MNKSRIAFAAAILLAGAAPILAQPAAIRPPRSRPPRPVSAIGASISARATAPSVPARISGATPIIAGSRPIRFPPTAPSWGVASVLSEEVEGQPRHPRNRRPEQQSGRPPGRRSLCQLHGRGRHRGARHRTAAPAPRPHLGDLNATSCFACSPRRASCRRSGWASCPIPPTRPAMSRSRRSRASACPAAIIIFATASSSSARAPPIAIYRHPPPPRRHRRRRGQGRLDHRPRAPDRRSSLDPGARPRRPPADQPDEPRAAQHARAAVQLDELAPGLWPRRRADRHRRPDHRDHGDRPDARHRAAADLEGLCHFPRPERRRAVPAARLRRRQFQLLLAHPARRRAAASSLEAPASTSSTARSASRSAASTMERHFPAESRQQMSS